MTPGSARAMKFPKYITTPIAILLPIAAILAIDLIPFFQYKMARDSMMSVVTEGMDLDVAMGLLRNKGFRVGDKAQTLGTKNSTSVDILLTDNVPVSIMLLKAMGMKPDFHQAETLEAGANNQIQRIQGAEDAEMSW